MFHSAFPLHSILVFGLLAASMCCSADAYVYRCEDESGRISFSDKHCSDGRETRFEQDPVPVVRSVVVDPGVYQAQSVKRAPKTNRKSNARSKKKVAGKGAGSERCFSKRQRLDRISNELRSGYKPKRGEKLKHQRREIEAYLRTFCR